MNLRLQTLCAGDTKALDWVGQGMYLTLVEVEGAANAQLLHSPEWLRDRTLSHVDGRLAPSAIWVARDDDAIVGHCIVRREQDDAGYFGLFTTTYVLPSHRRHGVAQALHAEGEHWFTAQRLARRATWTSSTNSPLIRLYERRGYTIANEAIHAQTNTRMVQLSTVFPLPETP